MRPWRALARGFRALVRPAAVDRDVADEVQHYVEEATAAHRARGLSPAEARRAAQLEIGNPTLVREQVRSSGWEHAVDTLVADVRYAARRLRASPGFTLVTVLTLGVGIGATTAIFGAVDPILLRPLPYPDADRLAMVLETYPNGGRSGGTFGMYHGLVDRVRTVAAMAVVKEWSPAIAGGGAPEVLAGQRVSASYLRVLGVAPALGRDFRAADDRPGGPDVAILSDGLWRRRFAADPGIVGRAVSLDGAPYVVIGVMPRGFENVLAPAAQVWAPLQYDMSQGRAWGHHLRTVARLRSGVTMPSASRELDALGQAVLREQRPETYGRDLRLVAAPLRDVVTHDARGILLTLLGAVLLVLAIACVNVTNLLLARGVRRRAEFAVRVALGAGGGRLLRQLLTECLLLAGLGGAAGLALALAGVRALVALSPAGLPRVGDIGLSGTVLAFGLALTTLAGLAFGAIPAWQATRGDPRAELERGSHRTTGGHRGARATLVAAEVALALVLLVGSGLLLRSLRRLLATDVGFDASDLLTMQVRAAGPRYVDDSAAGRFFRDALDAVRRVPGVTAAAFSTQLPLSGDLDQYGVGVVGEAADRRDGSYRYAVSPGWTEAMRIPLLRGRTLGDGDRAGTPRAALVSVSFARTMFGTSDPLGRQLIVGPASGYAIVGVVGDVTQVSLASGGADAVYIPEAQWPPGDAVVTIAVRARADPAALAPAIRRAIWSVDPEQAVTRVATMDDLVAASEAQRRFTLALLEAFGLAALLLAAAGIYGVLSGSVAERTREMAVRTALGATAGDTVRLVLREGLSLAGFGVGVGLVGAALASRAIAAMLYGVTRLDPVTYAGVVLLLLGTAALACAAPAWRASKVDPAVTLRAE